MAINAAPGALEKVRSFVNTADIETGEETLTSPSALSAWLGEQNLAGRSSRLSQADLERALELREGLRAALLANAGNEFDAGAIKALNRELTAATLALRFEPDGKATLEPAGSGLDAAIGRLAAIITEAMQDGTWARLKVCVADDCKWAFYDRSRNRSGHWCDMAECGNRAKVRAFRERRPSPSS